jgi:hypothetical protein
MQMKSTDQLVPAHVMLSDYLCFAVYSANLAFGKVYQPILEKHGLTYTQYITIIALWEEDNQTVSGLGEKLFLKSNTLTPILKKLEVMGYLERQRDPEDERQVRVSIKHGWRPASIKPASCRLQGFRCFLARSALLRIRGAQFGLQIFASQWFTTSLAHGADTGIVATHEMRIAHRNVLRSGKLCALWRVERTIKAVKWRASGRWHITDTKVQICERRQRPIKQRSPS